MPYDWLKQFTDADIFARPPWEIGLLTMFVEAWNERRYAMGVTTPYVVETGDFAVSRTVAGNKINWIKLQFEVDAAGSSFVRHLDDNMQPWSSVVGALASGVDLGAPPSWNWRFRTWRDNLYPGSIWPPPNGWTRKYPREISDLSAAGVEGQRARFVIRKTWTLWGSPTAHLTTPMDQYRHAAKLFDYKSGAWVLSEDQVSDPDIIETTGLAQPGDYFGPWIVNEIRDAIRLLRWRTHTGPRLWISYASESPENYWASGVDGWANRNCRPAQKRHNIRMSRLPEFFGIQTGLETVQYTVTGPGPGNDYCSDPAPAFDFRKPSFEDGHYRTISWRGFAEFQEDIEPFQYYDANANGLWFPPYDQPTIRLVSADAHPRATSVLAPSLVRSADFLAMGFPAGVSNTEPKPEAPDPHWHPYDSGLLDREMAVISTVTTDAPEGEIVWPKIGDHTQMPLIPPATFPDGCTQTIQESLGWQIWRHLMLMRYDVPGGFQYL